MSDMPTFANIPVPPRLGRNDHCWCGSGKKYKRCHSSADRVPVRQLSEILLELLEPVRDTGARLEPADARDWIAVATAAWNVSRQPETQRARTLDEATERFGRDSIGLIRRLVARALRLHPDDRRFVTGTRVRVRRNGELDVDVRSVTS